MIHPFLSTDYPSRIHTFYRSSVSWKTINFIEKNCFFNIWRIQQCTFFSKLTIPNAIGYSSCVSIQWNSCIKHYDKGLTKRVSLWPRDFLPLLNMETFIILFLEAMCATFLDNGLYIILRISKVDHASLCFFINEEKKTMIIGLQQLGFLQFCFLWKIFLFKRCFFLSHCWNLSRFG